MKDDDIRDIIERMSAQFPAFKRLIAEDRAGEVLTVWSGFLRPLEHGPVLRAVRAFGESSKTPPTIKAMRDALRKSGDLPASQSQRREASAADAAQWALDMNEAQTVLDRLDMELVEEGRLLMLRLMGIVEREQFENFPDAIALMASHPRIKPRLAYCSRVALQQFVNAGGRVHIGQDGTVTVMAGQVS